MEYVDLGKLKNVSLVKHSRESIIYKCSFDGNRYILKVFKDNSLTDLDSFDMRFDLLRRLNLKKSIIPEYIAESDSQVIGYLTELVLIKNIDTMINPLETYHALVQIKKSIEELHCNGIVHGDIHSGNIVSKNDRYHLIDFDNYSNPSRGIFLNPNNTLICVRDFIEKNGISPDMDVFLFNVLTFKLLSFADFWYWNPKDLVNFDTVKDCISRQDYGLFDSRDSRSICDDILTNTADEFLLNTIDESHVKKYVLNRKHN